MTAHDGDPMASRVAFFMEHAGYSYNPATETREQGRTRCAEELARAEEAAASRGWYVVTETDHDDCSDGDNAEELAAEIERGEIERLIVLLCDEDGRFIDSLGSVFVRPGEDHYVRVVAAELAADLLASHRECGRRVTCGACGNAWCEWCDPAPAALCHWCHGRGESTAPMDAAYEDGEMAR